MKPSFNDICAAIIIIGAEPGGEIKPAEFAYLAKHKYIDKDRELTAAGRKVLKTLMDERVEPRLVGYPVRRNPI